MKPYIWALLAALTWGIVPIIEKLGLVKVSVWTGLIYRCMGVIVGMTLIIFLRFHHIKNIFNDAPEGWYYLILGGFLASIIGQIFFYNALKSGEASQVVPIAATYPLVSFLLGLFFLKESFTAAKLGGIFFVILGVILLK